MSSDPGEQSDGVKQAWNEVVEQVGRLGATMRDRYRTAADDVGADEAAAVRSALDRFVAAGRELGARVGEVARDDEITADAKAAAGALDDALVRTVDLITSRLESVFRSGDDGSAEPGDSSDGSASPGGSTQ